MKILITTGIFEPEVGGPATYAPKLASLLQAGGNEVTVLTFSQQSRYDSDKEYAFKLIRLVRGNKLLNRIRFFFVALSHVRNCDLTYTLDWFAVGLPVALAAKLLRKPYVVRVGGDYLWEQRYLESGQRPMPLKDFYHSGIHRRSKYRTFYRLIRWVLSGARHVVFNSNVQRELYLDFYELAPARVSTIFNPVPAIEKTSVHAPSKEFVFWGRFIVMKNLDTLIRAFAQAKLNAAYTLLLIGDGPRKEGLARLVRELHVERRVSILPGMRRDDVLARVSACRAFVLPSWTDISPNQVIEALAIGLPALVTKENYLSFRDRLPETIDPRSVDDVAEKLTMLADDKQYREFRRKFAAISYVHTWDAALREHVALFERIVRV